MKVILYGAVSLDGFIADDSGGTDWVNDTDEWLGAVKDFGCIIIGRKTHDEVGIVKGAVNFVYTSHPERFNATAEAVYLSGKAIDVLNEIIKAGFEKVLLVGGAETNGVFAQAGLIDEIILDVHPLVLGEGMRLLGDFTKQLKCKLISSHSSPKGFVQLHYRIS